MEKGQECLRHFRIALAGLSRGEQKSIFDGLSSQMKAGLWQDRLSQGIEESNDSGQKEFLANIFEQIRPEAYSDEKINSQAREILIEVESAAGKVFENFDEYNALVTRLGENPCPTQVVPLPGLPDCECSSEFTRGTSGSGNDCVALVACTAGNCTTSRWGCGSLWLWTCDGLCG